MIKRNTKANYLRVCKGEDFEDYPCYKGYLRKNNIITCTSKWKEFGKEFSITYNIDLTQCDYVEVYDNGICKEIERRKV